MNSTEIKITPRQFGNIAALAMSHGCDITTYLTRHALKSACEACSEPVFRDAKNERSKEECKISSEKING